MSYLKTIIPNFRLTYLHPFGSTQIENLEHLDVGSDGPIFVCYDQEPLLPAYNKPLFDSIQKTFRNRKIILLNTERNSEEKNQILDQYNFIDCYYFFHILAAADWYRGVPYNNDIIPVQSRRINKKYITFNRITGNSRSYRSFLIAELSKLNLLNEGHVSYSEVCPVHGHYESNILSTIKNHNVSPEYVSSVQYELSNRINFPLRIDTCEDSEIPNKSFTIDAIPQMMESFLHVVTETCYWENKQHLTEKIFKPIVVKQPFVLLGCPNNLSYLKEYGFKTFNQWWDESYDEIENPIERLHAVVKIIEKICSMTERDLGLLLKEMQPVLEHNYNLFYSKKFVDAAWNELTTGLINSVARL